MLRASSRSIHPGMRPTTLSMVSTWRGSRTFFSHPRPPPPSLPRGALPWSVGMRLCCSDWGPGGAPGGRRVLGKGVRVQRGVRAAEPSPLCDAHLS
eukprot:15457308-Alexandrium_andersonii.AAC.1